MRITSPQQWRFRIYFDADTSQPLYTSTRTWLSRLAAMNEAIIYIGQNQPEDEEWTYDLRRVHD